MCNNPYWLLRVRIGWLEQPSDASLPSSPPTYNNSIGLSGFLNSRTLTCTRSKSYIFEREWHHFRVFRRTLVTLCFCWQWLLLTWSVMSVIGFSFCVIMPPVQGEPCPAAWQRHSQVNLALRVLFISPIFGILWLELFPSVDRHTACGSFDLIKADVVCEARVAYPGRTPNRKLKLILLQDCLYTTAVNICVVWPLFYVLRCWSLRWFNENLYI